MPHHYIEIASLLFNSAEDDDDVVEREARSYVGHPQINLGKRARRDCSPDRSMSPPQWQTVQDAHTGQMVPVRRMSEDVTLVINRRVNPQNYEFRVVSTDDVQRFEGLCGSEVAALGSQMEARMMNQEQYSQAQVRYAHGEYQAENSRFIAFCRDEVFGVRQEALQHQNYWISEVGHHQNMMKESQNNLLQKN